MKSSPKVLTILALVMLAAGCEQKQVEAPVVPKDLAYYRAHLEEAQTAVTACREKGKELQGVERANCKNASFALMSPTESVKTGKTYSTALGGSK